MMASAEHRNTKAEDAQGWPSTMLTTDSISDDGAPSVTGADPPIKWGRIQAPRQQGNNGELPLHGVQLKPNKNRISRANIHLVLT